MLRVQKVSRGEKHFREFLEKFDYQSFSEGEFITGLLNLLSDETKYIPKNLKGNIFGFRCFPDTIICKQLEKLVSVEDDSYKFYCSLFVRLSFVTNSKNPTYVIGIQKRIMELGLLKQL